MPPTAIGYIRVSTEVQAQLGVSLDAQRASIRGYCDLYGFELEAVEMDDGYSGKDMKRPGLERLLERARGGESFTLVVSKLDRLTRHIGDLAWMMEHLFGDGGNLSLRSVHEGFDTSGAMGRMMVNMIVLFAQWERETMAERTRAALAHKRAMGERVGHIPYGQKLAEDGVHLVPHEREREMLALIAQLHAQERSLSWIARKLNERGFTNRGSPWSHATVKTKLARTKG